MQCNNYPEALPVCRCADEDAYLWVGAVDGTPVHVMLTHAGTGSRTIIPIEEDGGEYKVPMPLMDPGQSYLVQVVTSNFAPLTFYPYQQSGTVWAPVSDGVSGVYLVAETCFDDTGSTYLGPDQWITLP